MILAFGAVLTSLPAHAESCGVRADVVAKLQGSFQEQLTGGGLHGHSAVVEVWTSPKTGTFTVITTDTAGMSCILATGTNWQDSAKVTRTGAQTL
ncbi:hypothetical protein KO498_00955 [Lentibacter algarum]|nr:hypothetical protein [Lentibacter algarum]